MFFSINFQYLGEIWNPQVKSYSKLTLEAQFGQVEAEKIEFKEGWFSLSLLSPEKTLLG